MLRIKSFIVIIVLSVAVFSASAQSAVVTIEQVIQTALKNNYDISVAKNQEVETANSNTLGNAGMLPTVSLNASGTFSNNATKQEFSTGQVIDKTGVQSQNINTGAYLTWTLFDGLKMFATHQRLKELESMGMLNTKIQIENTLVKVISAYYTIVMEKEMIIGLNENIAVSEERLKIANKKFEIGTTSKVDVLQAKIDMNVQKSTLMREKNILADAKAALNQLLLEPVDKDFDVTETIPLMNDFKFEDLKNASSSKNSDLLFSQKNIEVSKYMIKEAKALYYPRLNLNANYLFSRSENQAGFSLLNQNLGLNLGFTASWTIFNGFNTANTVKNLKLELQNSTLEYEQTKTQIELALLKAFRKYQNDMEIAKLEEDNNKLAKENLDVALERFRVGVSTSIEIKTAQQSYQESINTLSLARYAAKLSETQLLKLSGGVK